MRTTDRNAAAELAKRLEVRLIEPSEIDEAHQPPEDKSPPYANALMNETPASIERALHLTPADWELISKALEHYGSCRAA